MSAPLEFRRLADVEMRSIEWLDRPLWQRAAFHLVVGRKGAGKGTYLSALAARASRGELFEDPVNVLFVATEDSDEIDIKPRVMAAGGDPERIYTLVGGLRLPQDVPRLHEKALEIGDVGLIILDPIASHVRGDTHAEEPVRTALDPLNGLANDLDCLLIGVRHLSEKGAANGAIAAILGSSAWVQVPRAVLAVVPDDQQELLFHIAVIAGNRSARGTGRTFRIDLVDLSAHGLTESVTRAVEAGSSSKSIDDLLGAGADDKRKAPMRDGCRDIILRALADEPKTLDRLKAACIAEIGCKGKTAWEAANALKADGKVTCRNSGPGTTWLWYLTSPSDPDTLSLRKDTDFTVKSDPDFLTFPSNGTPQEDSKLTTDEQLAVLFKAGDES